jgi:hypothetical protein
MPKQYIWKGEPNRSFMLSRPCSCGCDSRDGRKGIGYLSGSDDDGNGFSIWIEDERIYRILEAMLDGSRAIDCPD